MRILVVIHGGAGTKVTGPEIRGWSLASALSERHAVTVALHDPPAAERDGMALVPFTRGSLLREARRHDAVVAPVLPPYLYAALKGTRTVTVSDQYDPVTLELSVFADQPGIARVIRAQLMMREAQLRFSDVVACAGAGQRTLLLEELEALRPRRASGPTVVNVPFGLGDPPPASTAHPLREHYPQFGAGDPIVLWWGKVWKWFDAASAIRAFALVAKQRPDARLVISAGKAPKAKFDRSERTDDARQLAAELGVLDRNVFFLDEWTPYDRRHEYLQDADLGLTLHADTPEAPFAARARYMDYLWAGLPCVLARGDEVADRFGTAGLATLVDPGDVEGAAAAILKLLADRPALDAAKAAGLALAEEYRWPALVAPLTDAIEQAAASRRERGRASGGIGRAIGRYYARRTVDHALAFARSTPR